jgi:predicted metal-dependent peptidase
MKTIDPTHYAPNHPMSQAMRRVSRYWFLCYSKLLSLEWIETTRFPFAATDGVRLYLNPQGVAQLVARPDGVGLLAFLLVHEALHALLGHGWRMARLKDLPRANVAGDYIINAMIAQRNREVGKDVFPLIPECLLDEALSGDKSLEQLYRELAKPDQSQPQPQPQPQTQPQTPPIQQPDNHDNADDEPNQPDNPDDGPGDDGPPTPPEPDQGGDTGHDPGHDPGHDTDGDPDLRGMPGTGAADNPEPTAEDGQGPDELIQQIEQDNERLLIADSIDRMTQSDTGTLGRRIAGERSQQDPLDWVALCREWLLHRTRSGWDSPYNPAIHGSTGLVCAGRRTRAAGAVVLVLDTSGSIGQDTYRKFLGHGQDILDELKPERLVLLSVSHTVADVVDLEPGDRVPGSLKGGGGTAFQPAFDWLQDNDIEPDVMIYLTDGWSSDLATLPDPGFPLLWLSTQRRAKEYPVGDVIMVTE